MTSLAGRNAFVTGGSRGIGKAIVKKLTEKGARVAFTYRNIRAEADAVAASTGEIGRASCRERV